MKHRKLLASATVSAALALAAVPITAARQESGKRAGAMGAAALALLAGLGALLFARWRTLRA